MIEYHTPHRSVCAVPENQSTTMHEPQSHLTRGRGQFRFLVELLQHLRTVIEMPSRFLSIMPLPISHLTRYRTSRMSSATKHLPS